MILYDFTLKYKPMSERIDDKDTLNPEVEGKRFKEIVSYANDLLGKECGLDGSLSAQIVGGKTGEFEMVICCKQEKVSLDECTKWIENHFMNNFSINDANVSQIREISEKEFVRLIKRADKNGYCGGGYLFRHLGFDYHDNYSFSISEKFNALTYVSKEEIISKAEEIMADASLIEEIERIYSDENEHYYYGNPVHYRISVGKAEAAKDIIEILISALKANSRILGSRVNYIYDISESCYKEEELENVFRLNKGTAVAIEMTGTDEDHGVYASSYHEVIDGFEALVTKYQLYTLCFFIEVTSKPGFAKPLVAAVQEDIHIIDIKEGRGNKSKAIDYITRLSANTKFEADKDEIAKLLPKQKDYSASEVYETYNKWFSNSLKYKVYKSYLDCEKLVIKDKVITAKPYDELKNMIGLAEIKDLVDQIINASKIQKIRRDMGIDNYKSACHMIFTGNPGSAKTTVARLLSKILWEEGVLENGSFIECGRADLVGKYVGWTAKQVRSKFREAKGGILFIDEAYSLVDSSHSFGDEAINTIVQEMENHRDDVIVIFAGYPKKMEEFLQRNEGLRSRVAFHLNFPDYSPDEMVDILNLMAKKKNLKLDDGVNEKCRAIFKSACKNEEFGNGRFARNLLEQAMLKQSDRVIREAAGKKITKKALSVLLTDDFDVNAMKQYKKDTRTFGFADN